MLTDLLISLVMLVAVQKTEITQYEIQNHMARQTQTDTLDNKSQKVWRGKVSIYAPQLGACLGCQTHWDNKGQPYWIRADGSILENDFSIAFNDLPVGSHISLVGPTGKSIGAIVRDTGGFKSLGRIADLTPIVAETIGAKTDDIVKIIAIP